MKITRYKLKLCIDLVNKKIKSELNNNSRLFKIAKKYCRNQKIKFKYFKCNINNINFIYDKENHWAETDCKNIWLNTYKNFTFNLLYYTLLHEKLHGIILRDGKYELSESLEHKIMYEYDSLLI